jgi:hypothetical protein
MKYIERLKRATTLSELDAIVEMAAADSTITNEEYTKVYECGLRIAQGW